MPIPPGTRLGHYRIAGQVGAGGMGEVYRAHDENLHRDVALKVLTERLVGSSTSRERFEREARAVAALSHPNILTIFDFGRDGETAYAVTELLDGQTLRQRIAPREPLPVRDAVAIARDVARGLAAAHAKRIVHRDIKPENVFLTTDGAVKILDFGLARSHGDPVDSITETLADAGAAGASIEPERPPLGGSPALTSPGDLLGTTGYMAPEQARGEMATVRSDVFALGCVLYEMLSARAPFTRGTQADTLRAILADEPPALEGLGAKIPRSVAAVLRKCLAKDAASRYADAGALLVELDAADRELTAPPPIEARSIVATLRRPAVAGALVLVIAAGAFAVYRSNARRARETWARQTAIPEAQRLEGENRQFEAYELAKQAEAVLGTDPALEALWQRVATPFRVTTDPPGAAISYRPYSMPASASAPSGAPSGSRSADAVASTDWRVLGTSPFESDRFPVGAFRIRIDKDGFETVEVARSLLPAYWVDGLAFPVLDDPTYIVDAKLTPAGGLPAGMLSVDGGRSYGLPLIPTVNEPIDMPAFFIDRTEVTNRAYREFVAAGAYSKAELWTEPFERNGAPVSAAEAIAELRDSTGRSGPASWVLGAPPDASEDLPVSGVSWYEANAYCGWRGGSLPTLFHWTRAAIPGSEFWIPFTPVLIAASNMGGTGPVAVGSRPGIGTSGAYDLAGNVREWTFTPSGAERHIVGGAWSDPAYLVNQPVAVSPWDRSATNGFRCVKYPEGEPPAALRRAFSRPAQDFSRDVTMSDGAFETEHLFYSYDRTKPLRASVDSSRRLEWGANEERVSIDAANGERLPMRLCLPAGGAQPPFQIVIFFPGMNLFIQNELPDTPDNHFFVHAGRVLVEPVYYRGFQRNDGTSMQRWSQPASRIEMLQHWSQDLGRVIDYLEQRPDLDASKVAYVGMSLGASIAQSLLPHDARLRAAILWCGGFFTTEDQSNIDYFSARARRTRTPILMLNGSRDAVFPMDPHQRALFRAWGTPEQDKRMVVYEGAGHWPLPMNEVIRESVDFLDRYLGPVQKQP